jgi:hypothetical protein
MIHARPNGAVITVPVATSRGDVTLGAPTISSRSSRAARPGRGVEARFEWRS